MGDRSSIGYQRTEDNSFIFFYGHWLGEDSIDVMATLLATIPEGKVTVPSLVAQLSNLMFEATEGSMDITPYALRGNYPTLLVRDYNGQAEVAMVEEDFDETVFNESEVMWVTASKFVDYADITSGLKDLARFEAIELMMLKGN